MALPAGVLLALSARLDPVRLILTRWRPRDIRRIAPEYLAPPMCCAPATRRWRRQRCFLDGAKGAVAVLVAQRLYGPDAAIVGGRRASRSSVSVC